MELAQTIVNREALNARIRDLQANRDKTFYTGGWDSVELEQVLTNGLDCLDPDRKDWLAHNPVALFQLHESINEELPSAWVSLIIEDANKVYANRPTRSKIKQTVLDKREFEKRLEELASQTWQSGEIEQILEHGLSVLTDERAEWLYNNPTALLELRAAILFKKPKKWQDSIDTYQRLEDARQKVLDAKQLA